MVQFRKSRYMRLKASHWMYILAGTLSIALTVVAITLSTQAVHADARLPKPAMTAPPIQNATPASLAPQKTAGQAGTNALHGIASWYGSVLNGHHTASGERFNMRAMTACHPTLPFGTLVRVVDPESKKSVVVRINDRGILDEGRIIDLSYAAAKKLNILKSGITKVDLEVISLGHPRHNQ
jgi:rare lipoprotein A